jgi:hypothetical protein
MQQNDDGPAHPELRARLIAQLNGEQINHPIKLQSNARKRSLSARHSSSQLFIDASLVDDGASGYVV